MKVGLVDADFIGRKKHRFPNLSIMKLSAFYKQKGDDVRLITNSIDAFSCDEVVCSKVFTDTPSPTLPKNAKLGGTGYFFDKAEPLPYEIEHHMPDYHIYDSVISDDSSFKEYRDYSIGFLTRGCFRKCKFCVNQKYNQVVEHSPLEEFFDPSRKKICMLDDNFLGFSGWKRLLIQLQDTKRKFKFKQGLDERLLTEEKAEVLFNSDYDGDFTFAFDRIEDYELIEAKLKLIRKYNAKKNIKFYVLCGFESVGVEDIQNTLKRIKLLKEYDCLPYIMRYQSKDDKPYMKSEWAQLYTSIARWCNQPAMVRNMTFEQFTEADQKGKQSECASKRALRKWREEVGEFIV